MDAPEYLILVHALSGLVAMLAPVVALLTRKPLSVQGVPVSGRLTHRISGFVYVLAMLVLSTTAVPLAFYQWNSILLIILFLSFYLTATAVWEVRMRRSGFNSPGLAGMCFSVLLVLLGVAVTGLSFYVDETGVFLLTSSFFAGSVWIAVSDFISALPASSAVRRGTAAWLRSHMMRMLASFTLTVTVYSILNFEAVTLFWRCVLPIAAGATLSALLMRRYLVSLRKEQE
jgi:hypothetical protein